MEMVSGSPGRTSERLLYGAHHLSKVELPLLQHQLRRQAFVVQRKHLLQRNLQYGKRVMSAVA